MAQLPSGIIGPHEFCSVVGIIDYNHGHELEDHSEPWENGHTYLRRGKKSRITQLTTITEVLLPQTRQSLLYSYKLLQSFFTTIRLREGLDGNFVDYDNMLIHSVEETTDMSRWAGIKNSGGLLDATGYKYYFTCVWSVQHPKPFSAVLVAGV